MINPLTPMSDKDRTSSHNCVTRNNYMEVLKKGMLIYKLNVFTDQF